MCTAATADAHTAETSRARRPAVHGATSAAATSAIELRIGRPPRSGGDITVPFTEMSPPERGGRPIRSSIALVAAALVAPWTAGRRARDVSAVWASAVAAVHIGVASALSAVLSSWTYLAGKGLILGPTEMDMGQDDLPPDTRGQVL